MPNWEKVASIVRRARRAIFLTPMEKDHVRRFIRACKELGMGPSDAPSSPQPCRRKHGGDRRSSIPRRKGHTIIPSEGGYIKL